MSPALSAPAPGAFSPSFPRLLFAALGCLLLMQRAHAAGADQIVINEVLYQRPSSDPTKVGQANEFFAATKAIEFIELHNPTAAPVDLGGWRLADGVDYLFPPGTVLADGGFLCVGQNPAHFQAQFGFAPLGPWIGELSHQKGRIRLHDAAGLIIDEVNYEVGFPWPTAAKGGGESMELINPSLDHDLGGSWRSSGTGVAAATLIPLNSANWHWRKGTSEASAPIEAWRALDFAEDASWSTGTAPFGYGIAGVTFGTPLPDMMQDDTAGVPGYSSVYLRHLFSLAEGQLVSQLTLRLFIDDGCIVWLNGAQVGSSLPPATPTYDAISSGSSASNGATAVTVVISNPAALLHPGQNVLAVQAFNSLKLNTDFRFNLDFASVIPTGAVRSPSPGRRNTVASDLAPPAIRQVVHTPTQPPVATDVVITAKVTDPDGVASVALRYQKLDPGGYIPRYTINASKVATANPAYENPANWTTLAMHDDGLNGDAAAGDSIFSAIIPATEQVHRRLIRYRVTATDAAGTPSTVTVPYSDDEQPNFAYFCYNGIPEWRGALRPVADAAGPLTPAQTFPTALTRSLQAYHVIAASTDVQNSQYNSTYDEVRFFGTIVNDGVVYDHIQFSNRGEFSTYNTGKNKWRFRFNRARGFAAKDNLGRADSQIRNGFSLEACAAPWATVNRGMAGLDSAISYKIYTLCGQPSPASRYVQLRVIDTVNESNAANQYDTDLWGLYLGVEDYDRDFLQAHGLSEGNIYKLGSSPTFDQKAQAETLPTNRTDWTTFSSQSTASPLPNEAYWKSKMDVNEYYTFHALNRFIGNVDLRAGANHFFYHRATDDRWVALPWDLDMMFIAKNHWYTSYDGKNVPGVIVQHRLYDVPALKIELKNRARELLDLMGENGYPNGGQIGQLIDEFAQIVNPTGADLTWADIDAALWNQNPKTTGSASSASGQNNPKGNFYRTPWGDTRGVGGAGGNWRRWLKTPTFVGTVAFEDFAKFLTDYTTNVYPAADPPWTINNANLPSLATNPDVQLGYGYKYLEFEANDTGVPGRPTITYAGSDGFPANDLRFASSPFAPNVTGGSTFAAMEWRLGEVSAPGVSLYDPAEERIYEVQPLWSSGELTTFASAIQVPASAVRTGHTYRARVRHKDANGRWSRWSAAAQFISGEVDVAAFRENLLITELNYHPFAPRAHELAAGYGTEDFEFIELKNIGNSSLELTDLHFTTGVEANFPAGTMLAPGGFGLVVKNQEAFRLRYGTGHDPQILATMGGSNLANGGELVALTFGQDEPIREFEYNDADPWPTSPDGEGPTLVLANPASRPDHALAASWRASVAPGGSPGADDAMTYGVWSVAYPGAEAPAADTDGDGLVNKLEYALGGNPLLPGTSVLPTGDLRPLDVAGESATYLTITFTHPNGLVDVSYVAQFSDSLATWSSDAVLVSSTFNADGTLTEVWRSPQPVSTRSQRFVRVKVP